MSTVASFRLLRSSNLLIPLMAETELPLEELLLTDLVAKLFFLPFGFDAIFKYFCESDFLTSIIVGAGCSLAIYRGSLPSTLLKILVKTLIFFG